MASIDWHGLEKLEVDFSNASQKAMKQGSSVIKNNTEKLKTSAKAKAPVDTGFLQKSITSEYPSELEGKVADEASYAGYQEYGTRFQPGTPHIRPALKEVEPQFKKDMDDVLKGVFE